MSMMALTMAMTAAANMATTRMTIMDDLRRDDEEGFATTTRVGDDLVALAEGLARRRLPEEAMVGTTTLSPMLRLVRVVIWDRG